MIVDLSNEGRVRVIERRETHAINDDRPLESSLLNEYDQAEEILEAAQIEEAPGSFESRIQAVSSAKKSNFCRRLPRAGPEEASQRMEMRSRQRKSDKKSGAYSFA
jgi:hypothetical protein